MSTVVSLNGELVGPEAAKISIFDRGFLYGDSVYEVVRTYESVLFELQSHLVRLEGSAARIGMGLPASLETIAEEAVRTHRSSQNPESYLRIVATRGAGEIGLDPALARNPARIIIAQPLKTPPKSVYLSGVTIALVSVRKNLRGAIDPQAKTGNYLNSVMALAEARQRDCFEAVMLDHKDFVTEGASSNIFAVRDGVIETPPVDAGILMGVTRSVVFRIAEAGGFTIREVPLKEECLKKEADEVFITSSIREIVPVVRIDEAIVGEGRPGPTTTKLRDLFRDYVEEHNRER